MKSWKINFPQIKNAIFLKNGFSSKKPSKNNLDGFFDKNPFFKKIAFFICEKLIFQDFIFQALEQKNCFFQNLTSSIFQLSYAFSSVKKYLKLALLS